MRRLLEKPHFRSWAAVVGASTFLLAGAYAMVQQATRLSANQAPLIAAQQAKAKLEAGKAAAEVIPELPTKLDSDAAVFVSITDSKRHILASNANLYGRVPLPPPGVFSYTAIHGLNRFTWQPENGVRLATQVMSYRLNDNSQGFIVAGQSLNQAEKQIDTYGKLALSAWIAVLAWVTLIYFFAGHWVENKKNIVKK